VKIVAPYARFSGNHMTPQFIVLLLSLATIGCSDTATQQPADNAPVVTSPKKEQPRTPKANDASRVIEGKVIRVADGDTVTVLDGSNAQHKIRLQGIDAPESNQAFGTRSQQAQPDGHRE